MLPQDSVISIPPQRSPACSTTQPLAPDTTYASIELPDAVVVRRASIVLVVATEFGVQGFLLLIHWRAPVLFAPVGDCLQPSTEPFGYRLHMHCESSLPATGAEVLESKEIEALGLFPLLLRIPRCMAPEFNQPRLLRVQETQDASSRPGELHPQALTDSGLERLRSSGSYRPVNAGCNNGQ